MAKILRSHKFSSPRVGGFAPSYNWSSLFDGKVRLLTAGDDYQMDTKKFRNSLRKAAAKAGFRVNFDYTDAEGEVTAKADDAAGCIVETVPMTEEEKQSYASKVAERKAAKKAKKAASNGHVETDTDTE